MNEPQTELNAAPAGGRAGYGGALLGTAGAVAGAVVGVLLFVWIARQGFYAMVLPGAATGIGAALLSGRRSAVVAAVSGVVGTAAGVVGEWQLAPFRVDDGLGYFVTHLHDLKPFTLAMIGLGAAIAVWFGLGRDSHARRRPAPDAV